MSQAQKYILTNTKGTTVILTNVGASIMDIRFQDKTGELQSLVAGFERPEQYADANYQKKNLCLGATVGRVAGRIAKGVYNIYDTYYALELNNGQHLHSESCGFQHQFWEVESHSDSAITFSLKQAEGSCGYTGNVEVRAHYELTDKDELKLTYTGKTDASTYLNLCNHSYFNLSGAGSVLDHQLILPADRFLETDKDIVPTGKFLAVEDHKLDFRKGSSIKDLLGAGLDHAFELKEDQPVKLYAPNTGIGLVVTTNQPAVVVYTPPNFEGLDLSNTSYENYPAICLEVQGFPDAPNHQNFPSVRLDPGQEYLSKTTYAFSVDEKE